MKVFNKAILIVLLNSCIGIAPVFSQQCNFKKTAYSKIFRNTEWIVNLADSKIYDDDLLISKLVFTEKDNEKDSVCSKVDRIKRKYFQFGMLSDVLTIVDSGVGKADFFSTKFRKKIITDFYYAVVAEQDSHYLVMIIDIEQSGREHLFPFRIVSADSSSKLSIFDLMNHDRQWADYRVHRVR